MLILSRIRQSAPGRVRPDVCRPRWNRSWGPVSIVASRWSRTPVASTLTGAPRRSRGCRQARPVADYRLHRRRRSVPPHRRTGRVGSAAAVSARGRSARRLSQFLSANAYLGCFRYRRCAHRWRRHRHHRPRHGRRRGSVGRRRGTTAGTRRLRPARRGCRRWPPHRVQRAGHRRQLLVLYEIDGRNEVGGAPGSDSRGPRCR